ncbi:Probable 5-formyltetrahydrofolate cyclo-ligase [Seminavis robusta]|uniref:5-formyltetrahydrofolate cyclo-ligase n=1 Tax=Seminavis robusta TaxID=568900 RepID=A0A9N8DB59_9STRA|nr:Probable 5-formyltetrahydrofolate cyclo-ligase [Seminavis robusta]|eukprot:Sro72_g039950.1 Probable 5-formyltetrahydrofolate cyclo-ligase (274) ;mRNA; f:84398-85389
MGDNNDSNNNDSIVQQKKVLRKQVRSKLKALTKETIQEQSIKVWDRLFQLPQYQTAKSVGLFLSMPKGEIDTDPALKHAMEHNKTIYVPEVGKNFELADMELLQVIVNKEEKEKDKEGEPKESKEEPPVKKPRLDEEEKEPSTTTTTTTTTSQDLFHKNWPRNKWGIPEPPADMPIVTAKPGDIDLLVVPGLAFDRNGDRLGQGKGYYDRFIERMCQGDQKGPYLVAVGLQAQVVDESIPVAQYDRRMDMVLLPDESIVVSKEKDTTTDNKET